MIAILLIYRAQLLVMVRVKKTRIVLNGVVNREG